MYTVCKVKFFRGRDGYGFNAELLKDGKKIAFVIDEGCGGCLHYEWVDIKERDVLCEYVKTLPSLKTKFGDISADIDLYVSRLADDYETGKKFKRLCKTKTIFRLKSDNEDAYRMINRHFDSAVKVFLLKKYGESLGEIVNEKLI